MTGIERERIKFNQLGRALYGENWDLVAVHNVRRITGGAATEVTALTVEQLNRMIDGMRKLQGKRAVKA